MAARLEPITDPARWVDQVLGAAREATASVPTMPMDLFRSGDHYVLHVDIPGADPGTIDVGVEDSTLTIRAERTARTEGEVQWLARERTAGSYVRRLTVGRGLALDAVDATYTDGVLTLTIPVAEEARPRRIEVRHAGSGTPISRTAQDE